MHLNSAIHSVLGNILCREKGKCQHKPEVCEFKRGIHSRFSVLEVSI